MKMLMSPTFGPPLQGIFPPMGPHETVIELALQDPQCRRLL